MSTCTFSSRNDAYRQGHNFVARIPGRRGAKGKFDYEFLGDSYVATRAGLYMVRNITSRGDSDDVFWIFDGTRHSQCSEEQAAVIADDLDDGLAIDWTRAVLEACARWTEERLQMRAHKPETDRLRYTPRGAAWGEPDADGPISITVGEWRTICAARLEFIAAELAQDPRDVALRTARDLIAQHQLTAEELGL